MDSLIPNQTILRGVRGGKGLFQVKGPNKGIRSMPVGEGPISVRNLKAKQSGGFTRKGRKPPLSSLLLARVCPWPPSSDAFAALSGRENKTSHQPQRSQPPGQAASCLILLLMIYKQK